MVINSCSMRQISEGNLCGQSVNCVCSVVCVSTVMLRVVCIVL